MSDLELGKQQTVMEHPIEISVSEVAELQKQKVEHFFLDCRTPPEYEAAKIDGGKLIPMNEIPARLDEFSTHKDGRVIVYCHIGGRSLQVANWLRQNGFENAQSMAGGIEAWSVEIDPSVPRY